MPEFVEPKDLAAAQLAKRDVQILDVRSPEEYAAGHVEGAVNVPPATLEAHARTLAPDAEVVTYCNMFHPGSSRGEAATERLAGLGLDAKTLNGGFPAWRNASLPVKADVKTEENAELEETR